MKRKTTTTQLSVAALLAMPIERDNKQLNSDKLKEQMVYRSGTISRADGGNDTGERRVSIAISTEAAIRQRDRWSGEEYDEVLLHGEENVDLTRAATAKLRYMHGYGEYGELPIGKLENVRIEKRVLRAEAIFSRANPDADMLWAMVEEGTLTEISVGGIKRELRITERSGQVPLVEVTRWEFHEASVVDIGADPAAGIGRNYDQKKQGDLMNEILRLQRELDALRRAKAAEDTISAKQKELEGEIARVLADAQTTQEDLRIANEANAEMKRQVDINDIAREFGEVPTEHLQGFLSDKTKTVLDFSRSLLTLKKERQGNVGFQRGSDHSDVQRAIGDYLITRAGFAVAQPHPQMELYRGAGLLDLARAVTGYTGYNPNDIVQRAMSTDDFPTLLGTVTNRMLSMAFEEAEGTFQIWTRAVDVTDFRTMTEVTRDRAGGRLGKVNEGGEKKSKEFSETKETWKLFSYGDEITLTREMIINDDLNAFVDVIIEFGERAKRTANGIVYDLLQGKGEYSSYKMGDTKSIFHTDHKNTGTGANLTTTEMSDGRTKMRRQTSKAGDALNIAPKFLLVSPERETTAGQLLTSEADATANHAGVTNPFKGTMTLVVDAELDKDPWYLASSRRTIKVGYLQGTNREPIVREKNRSLSSVTFECVFDFGVVAEDFRGLYKNTGV